MHVRLAPTSSATDKLNEMFGTVGSSYCGTSFVVVVPELATLCRQMRSLWVDNGCFVFSKYSSKCAESEEGQFTRLIHSFLERAHDIFNKAPYIFIFSI